MSFSEKWYLNATLASSLFSIVPLSTASVNFSCVPRLRAASAAVSFAWPSSLDAACSYPSIRTLDLCLCRRPAYFACRPFTDIFLPDFPIAPSANLAAKLAADSG